MFRTGMVILAACVGITGSRALAQIAGAPAESRGVWLDKAQMLEGREKLLTRLDRLRDAHFNTVYVAVQIRGTVMYPGSAILPQYEEARKSDPNVLDWLLPAIRDRGMRVEAWTEFGFYTYWTPNAAADASRGPILDRRPDLAAVDHDGKLYVHNEWGDFYSLCPSNPQCQEILSNLYVELLGLHDFDGLNLDRIRYPDDRFCYCDYCKERFRHDTGIDLDSIIKGTKQESAFVRWRKEQLTGFMERFSGRIRTSFPDVRITSAVVPPSMIDEKGQDWPTWIERGYLDAVMPMLYEEDLTGSIHWIQKRLGDSAPVFAGICAVKSLAQIEQLREMRVPGVTIWYSGTVDPLLPDLQRGLFSSAAVSPLYLEAYPADVATLDSPPSDDTPRVTEAPR